MATNGAGIDAFREVDLLYLERLPSNVRALLRDAPTPFSSEEVYRFSRRYGLDAQELEDDIKQRIASYQETETRRVYPNHPQLGVANYDKWTCTAKYKRELRYLRYRRGR